MTTDGVLLSLALIIGLLENAIPPIFTLLPFAKIGIGNIVIVFALVRYGLIDCSIITVLKCVLLAVFSGNISMVIYSLSGAFASIIVMQLLLFLGKNSLAAISAIGSAFSNIAQVLVACLVVASRYPLGFLFYLITIGMLAGAVVGVAAQLLIRYLSKVQTDKA